MICWASHANFLEMLDKAEKEIKPKQRLARTRITSIVCSGASGVILGSALADRLKIPVVVVEPAGSKHSGRVVNINEMGKNALFLDDHVSGGRTYKHCAITCAAALRYSPELAALNIKQVYEYNPYWGAHRDGKLIKVEEHPILKGKGR